MEKVKFGVIGMGNMGSLHAENLLKMREVYLKVIYDIDVKKASYLARMLGIPNVAASWEEVMDDPEIDAIVIAVPTVLHYEIISSAIKSGKRWIFTEKPLTHNLESAKELLKLVEKNNTKLQVGFNRRFDHNYKKIHDIVKGDKIGEIHIIRDITRDPEIHGVDFLTSSGGLFYDIFIHEFDIVRYITSQEVERVYAVGSVKWEPRIKELGDYDTAVVLLEMSGGAIAVIEGSMKSVYGYDQRLEVFGSKGSILILNDRETATALTDANGLLLDKPLQDVPPHRPLMHTKHRYEESYFEELYEFVRCIFENKTPLPTAEDGYKANLVAECAKISSKENKPILVGNLKGI
ncbi:TPA: inositol 2-dehydrogenase [Candidatus Poribacteria bacterium]|nr:inositol 2-dehydrogenase [Candidatus Poribacteria bacterium]